jgi:hypothetical protein
MSIIVLLGLLTFLVPIGPSMGSSNAIAFEDYDYGYQPDQYMRYAEDIANENYYKSQNSDVIPQKIKCNNIIYNLNNVDITIERDDPIGLEPSSLQQGEDLANSNEDGKRNGNNNFDLDCINNNDNEGGVPGPQDPEGPEGPQGPEPTTATLTVNKQVFGCSNIIETFPPTDPIMDCQALQYNSPLWLNCNNPYIIDSIFCQSLPESIFDIQVLDSQNTQIQQFEGSIQGTTIQNLEPGTYLINEINTGSAMDELGGDPSVLLACGFAEFAEGGLLFNSTASLFYNYICLKYEDEQGNDCSTIRLAAGEESICTVKNYIRLAGDN